MKVEVTAPRRDESVLCGHALKRGLCPTLTLGAEIMTGPHADLTGIVRSFSGTSLDSDGVPYFEFLLTLSPSDCPYPFPLEVVLFLSLVQDNAASIVTLVVAACAFQFPIDVFLHDVLVETSRVRDVKKSMLEEYEISEAAVT